MYCSKCKVRIRADGHKDWLCPQCGLGEQEVYPIIDGPEEIEYLLRSLYAHGVGLSDPRLMAYAADLAPGLPEQRATLTALQSSQTLKILEQEASWEQAHADAKEARLTSRREQVLKAAREKAEAAGCFDAFLLEQIAASLGWAVQTRLFYRTDPVQSNEEESKHEWDHIRYFLNHRGEYRGPDEIRAMADQLYEMMLNPQADSNPREIPKLYAKIVRKFQNNPYMQCGGAPDPDSLQADTLSCYFAPPWLEDDKLKAPLGFYQDFGYFGRSEESLLTKSQEYWRRRFQEEVIGGIPDAQERVQSSREDRKVLKKRIRAAASRLVIFICLLAGVALLLLRAGIWQDLVSYFRQFRWEPGSALNVLIQMTHPGHFQLPIYLALIAVPVAVIALIGLFARRHLALGMKRSIRSYERWYDATLRRPIEQVDKILEDGRLDESLTAGASAGRTGDYTAGVRKAGRREAARDRKAARRSAKEREKAYKSLKKLERSEESARRPIHLKLATVLSVAGAGWLIFYGVRTAQVETAWSEDQSLLQSLTDTEELPARPSLLEYIFNLGVIYEDNRLELTAVAVESDLTMLWDRTADETVVSTESGANDATAEAQTERQTEQQTEKTAASRRGSLAETLSGTAGTAAGSSSASAAEAREIPLYTDTDSSSLTVTRIRTTQASYEWELVMDNRSDEAVSISFEAIQVNEVVWRPQQTQAEVDAGRSETFTLVWDRSEQPQIERVSQVRFTLLMTRSGGETTKSRFLYKPGGSGELISQVQTDDNTRMNELVLIEDENCVIGVTTISDDQQDRYQWAFFVRNLTGETILLRIGSFEINGLGCNPGRQEDIVLKTDQQKYVSYTWDSDTFLKRRDQLGRVETVRFTVDVYDSETDELIEDRCYTVYPHGQDSEAMTEEATEP